MATELGKAYVQIMPSAKGISGSIQKAINPEATAAGKSAGSNIATSLSKSLGNIGGKLTKAITLPVAGAATAAAGLVGVLGFKRLVGLDTAQAKLKGLGYEAEAVERISGQVETAIMGGMTTMGEGVSIAAGGLAAGVKEGKELQHYIKLVGDAAVGANRPVDEMAQIFNRVQGGGRLMTMELNMIEQGLPGFAQAMANDLADGSLEAFRDMVTNGEVGSDDFLNVMDDFAGGMAKAYSESWEGMAKNTLAYVGIIGESLLEGLFEDGKEGLANLIEVLQSDDVMEWAQETGEKIREVANDIVEVAQKVIGWWNDLSSGGKKAVGIFAAIAIAIGPIMLIVAKLIGIAMTLIPVFKAIGIVIAAIASPIGLVVAAIIAAAALIFIYWEPIKEFFLNMWEMIKEAGLLIWENLKEGWANAVENLTMAWESVTEFFSTLWETVKEIFTVVWGVISSIVTGYVNAVRTIIMFVFNAIKTYITTVFNVYKTIIMTVWNAIRTVITTVTNTIRTVITTVFNTIRSVITSVVNGIRSVITSVFNTIRSIITSVINTIRSVITSGFNTARSVISSTTNSIRSAVSSVFNSLRGIVSGAMNGVKSAVSSGIRGALSAVTGLAGNFKNAGRKIVTSIADGIKGAASKVTSAVSNLASKIRDFLPFSPPKTGPLIDIMDVKWGETIGGGIMKGKNVVGKAMDSILDFDLTKRAKFNNPNQINNDDGNVSSHEKQPIILQVDGKTFAQIMGDYTSAEGGNRIRRFERGLA